MAYIAAADLRERTHKSFATNLILEESITDTLIDAVIAQVTTQVELELSDDFEPPSPDNDEIINADGSGTTRVYLPRRVRSLTTVETRLPWSTTYTTQASTTYYLRKSLNTAGTAMIGTRASDFLDALSISTYAWPEGADTIRLTGKFGWAGVPEDIKRLVALRTYALVRATADPLHQVVQRTTADAVLTFGPSPEEEAITSRYSRQVPVG